MTLETKARKKKSPAPSPQKLSLRKKKESIPEYEELEDSTEETGSSSGGTKSEEEDEPTTPKTERMKEVETRSSDRKKFASTIKKPTPHVYRSSVAPKQQTKTP